MPADDVRTMNRRRRLRAALRQAKWLAALLMNWPEHSLVGEPVKQKPANHGEAVKPVLTQTHTKKKERRESKKDDIS